MPFYADEQETRELEEDVVEEDVPEGTIIPTMERDAKGRLLPGHSPIKKRIVDPHPEKALQMHKQQLRFLTSNQEVRLKKEALHRAIDETDVQSAIKDVLKTAKNSDNPYVKHMFYNLFFDRVLGRPSKEVERVETTYQTTNVVDYSRLSKEELRQLESLAAKVVPQITEDHGR